MAEIGLIASVVSVAGAGLQIAMSLRQLASEIREAAREVHEVATSVSLFSMTLKQLGNCVNDKDSPHSESALDTLGDIVTNCRSWFNTIESMISEVRKNTYQQHDKESMSLGRRVQWLFKKSRVKYLISQLESSKLTLSIMLQVFTLRTVMEETGRSGEGIEAARKEVEYLQAEIQSLVLDRVWVQRKEEGEIKDGISEKDTPQLSAKADLLHDRRMSGPSSTTIDEADQSLDNSRTLTLFVPNSLAALDACLSEEGEDQNNISQNTISRSMIAINYLVDCWTIGVSSDARTFLDDDRLHNPNRTALPNHSKENLSSKPSTRFTTSQSRSDSNRSGKSFQSHEQVPTSSGTLKQEFRRRSKTRDDMQSIPFMPLTVSCSLIPVMSYKTANPGLIWESTYEAHLETFNSELDNFCWTIVDGITAMTFHGKYYMYSFPTEPGFSSRASTVLSQQWFSHHALLQEGYAYRKAFGQYRIDLSQSPLTRKNTAERFMIVEGQLDYKWISKLRRISCEKLGYNNKYMTIDEHLEYLWSLGVLKILADGKGSTAQEQSTPAEDLSTPIRGQRRRSEGNEGLEGIRNRVRRPTRGPRNADKPNLQG